MANDDDSPGVSRRGLLAMAAGGAAIAAGAPKGPRMPVVYLPHGGGPWPFVELGFFQKTETDALAAYLRELPAQLPAKPRAMLVVSAHWEEPVPSVMTAPRPPMLYDYYGFPPESYRVQWPAPGAPDVAARTRALLGAAGFETGHDDARGFDHGTFVPLKVAFPNADVPTTQLSLKAGLDPDEHLAIGRALAPLRDEGVLIVGSGMSFHNLRAFNSKAGHDVAEQFDGWLRTAAVAEPSARALHLRAWSSAPAARQAHPREEHLLPLMVIAGAAGESPGRVAFSAPFGGARVSAIHYG
jgi:aromatic ring-opening dioxygenase catalytic subunit (LigB family)